MGHKQKQRQRQRQQQEQPFRSEEHALLREMFAEMEADIREEQMNEQKTVVSLDPRGAERGRVRSDNEPGPSHARGRGRALSDNNSDSDKHDSKRLELEADSGEEMATQATYNLTQTTSNISDMPPSPPTATATAARTSADQADTSSSVEDPIIIADLLPENFLSGNKKRVWRKLDSILHQIKALMAHVAGQPTEVDTEPPLSASMPPAMRPVSAPQPAPDLQQQQQQSHPASMQPEPLPQPALASQQPQPAAMQPEPAPQPSADPAFSSGPPPPRHSVHPPKPRVSPRGSPSYVAAAAAGAAAGAAAATAAAASSYRYRFPPSASGSPRRRASAAADPSSFSTTLYLRSNFVFKAPPGALPATADSLKERLKSFLQARLPGADIPIVDAVLFGQQATSTRVFFTLDSLAAANDLVGRRCALRGSGASIQDYLSPEEQRLKSSLWPRFLEAKARGQRPQFQRARLIVSS